MNSAVEFSIKSLYSESIRDMETYIMFRIAKRVVELTPELTAKGRKPLKLSMGAPVVKPPQVLIDTLIEAMKDPAMHTYSTPRGEAFFLEAVAQRMKQRFGVDVSPRNEVCSLIGSKEGLSNLFRGLISYRSNPAEKEGILIPDPGYASYGDAIRICGGEPFPIQLTPENNYQPDLEKVIADYNAKGVATKRIKGLVINYPSNPLGATCTLDYLKHAVDVCRKHNMLLISDAAYADLYFPGEKPPHSALEIPGAKTICVELHTLSKPYAATGWRIGYAVGNPDAIDAIERVKGTMDSGIFKAMQKAAAVTLSDASAEQFIHEQNAFYQKLQERMLAGLKELGWPIEQVNPPKATFYLWMPVPPRFKSAAEFCEQLLEVSGVVAVPGTAFGEYGEGFFRMSLVESLENLDEIIRRMKEDGFSFN